eukprot:335203_1
MKQYLPLTIGLVVVIFHSDIFVMVCFQLCLLDDTLYHYFGTSNNFIFQLKNSMFNIYEDWYSPFDKTIVQKPLMPTIVHAHEYQSYEQLQKVTNNFKNPTVVRGLFKNSSAMHWDSKYLNNTIGNEICPVLLSHSNYFEMDRKHKSYSQILHNVASGGYNYVSGDRYILFDNTNNLFDDFNFSEILGDSYINSNDFMPSELYLFIGNKNTGTAWHSAPNRSLFVMIKGVKKWKFIDPKYAIYLKPQRSQLYSRILLAFGKFIKYTKHANHFKDSMDYYSHIPHYEVLLYPGDAITVPSWWWHHVSNMEDNSNNGVLNIGVDIDTKTWNYDFMRSLFPRFFSN